MEQNNEISSPLNNNKIPQIINNLDNNQNKDNSSPKITPIITNDIPENIVTSILDKIISEIIISKKVEKMYTHFNDHCYNYLKNTLTPYFNQNFFYHENGIDDLNYQQNIIHYSQKPITKVNTWVKIIEPSTPTLDRHIAGKNKFIELPKDEIPQTPVNKTISEEIDKNNENIFNININKISNKPKKKGFGYLIKQKELTSKKKEDPMEIIVERKKSNKIVPLDLPYYDLPEETYKNIYCVINDNEENNLLRKEKETQILKKEQERIEEEKRKKKEQKKYFLKMNHKDFDFNKLTMDPNGKVINVLNQNADNFLKDFASLKLHVNDKKMTKRNSIKQTEPQNKLKRKSVVNNIKRKSDLKIEKNPIDNMNNLFNNIPKKKVGTEITPSGNNYLSINPEVGVIISNGIKSMQKEGGFDFVRKYNKPSMNEFSRMAYNNSNNYMSNLYSSHLASSYDMNSSIPSNIGDRNNKDYIGYKIEFNENNNPLFKNALRIPSNPQSSKSVQKSKNNKYNLKNNLSNVSVINNGYRRRINSNLDINNNNRYDSYKSIKLNDNFYSMNLQSIFYDKNDSNMKILKNKEIEDSVNILEGKNSYLNKAVSTSKNNKKQYRIRSLPLITETDNNNKNRLDEFVDNDFINQFNFHIIKNKDWGNELASPQIMKSVAKSQEIQLSDGNIFRRKASSRLKESGINVINCIRNRSKKSMLGPYSTPNIVNNFNE